MARQQFGSSLRAVSGFLSKSFDPNPLRTSFISRINTANNNRMNEHIKSTGTSGSLPKEPPENTWHQNNVV